MKFAIDKIEDNIVVLENIETGEIINEEIANLPSDIKEKDILRLENNQYALDILGKEDRIKRIMEKMNKLRQEDNNG